MKRLCLKRTRLQHAVDRVTTRAAAPGCSPCWGIGREGTSSEDDEDSASSLCCVILACFPSSGRMAVCAAHSVDRSPRFPS
jgi:hypothetical protein